MIDVNPVVYFVDKITGGIFSDTLFNTFITAICKPDTCLYSYIKYVLSHDQGLCQNLHASKDYTTHKHILYLPILDVHSVCAIP